MFRLSCLKILKDLAVDPLTSMLSSTQASDHGSLGAHITKVQA